MDADEKLNSSTFKEYAKNGEGGKHSHVSDFRVSYKLIVQVEGSENCATPIVKNSNEESLESSKQITILCPNFFTPMLN
jgi:hypothetical protein